MKTLGNYTATATKAIKAGNCIICNKAEDGYIYTANGFFIFKMTAPEYDAFIRPAAGCDPGNWSIEDGTRAELQPGQMDIIKIFNDALGQINSSTTATACRRSPLEFTSEKMTLTGFYNPAADVAAFYNKLYITSFSGGTLHATKATAAAIVMDGEDALAMILPVRPDAAKSRAVKAYFTEPSDAEQKNDNSATALEQLQRQNAEQAEQLQRAEAMREAFANKITELCDEITSRNNEIAALKEQLNEQPAAAPAAAEQPAPDLKTAAEMIAERFRAFAGVEAVIKGATTSAPVVWLKGNTKQHENEITAAGAKWSGKKSAYYIKVA